MSAEHPFDDISGLKQSEADIRHIFNRYITTLFNTKWKISNEMTEWSKKLINQIQEYVAQQKELLEQEHAKKVTYLNTLRDQVLEQALQYGEKKDTEYIKELINQCNTLKVELPMLVYVDRPIPSIQLISDEQMVQQSDNEFTVQKIEDEQSPNELIERYENDTVIRLHTAESSPSMITPKNTKKKSQRSLVTKSLNKKNQSTTYPDDSVEECPICSMVFSLYMDPSDRSIHVEEHFSDNLENHWTTM